MEFDELQQIWNAQTSEALYAINEQALHNRILSKMKQARRITNTSELLLILVNLGAGSFVLSVKLSDHKGNGFMYLAAAWMFATAVFLLVSRIIRIKEGRRFDRSMHGDLNHAISMATYQVRLSQLMRWNVFPIGALMLLSAGEGQKLLWAAVVLGVSFVLIYFLGNREHNFYKARKRELEILQRKLETKD